MSLALLCSLPVALDSAGRQVIFFHWTLGIAFTNLVATGVCCQSSRTRLLLRLRFCRWTGHRCVCWIVLPRPIHLIMPSLMPEHLSRTWRTRMWRGYLLGKLSPALFDGVVFLDSKDRQMILQRSNGLKVPVAQSGIALTRRFTFFDQVHTTGTDVKQAASVTAVVTLGKDLVFRDYAQGAYRMRGVGKGQRLRLYLIPEVLSRIHATLGSATTGNSLLDVPAWLLLNSMQMESLQFIKLSVQELANVWRKKALQYLLRDSIHFHEHSDLYTDMARCRRFHMQRPFVIEMEGEPPLPDVSLLRSAIQEFREPVAYPVDSVIDTPLPFLQRLMDHMRERPQELIVGDAASQQLLHDLMHRLASSLAIRGPQLTTATNTDGSMNLDSEIVHEQEAEEEQEQEAEQEEQRISVASRDDELHIPWRVETLQTHGKDHPTEGSCFYPLRRLRVRPQQPFICVDPVVQVSDNYYREFWHGAGERRLKNVFLSLEWIPRQSNENAAHVIHSGLITLAEGESLRWMMHHQTPLTRLIGMALRVVSSGRYMDFTEPFVAAVPRVRAERVLTDPLTQRVSLISPLVSSVERDGALLLYRFFNNDMFFFTWGIGCAGGGDEGRSSHGPSAVFHRLSACPASAQEPLGRCSGGLPVRSSRTSRSHAAAGHTYCTARSV
ncbi:hypothetical protein C3747_141g55 [Trypanosoma cruzi]|uniref:ubiquitinyl hydrolase 1 n=1 Tax=Trypanosoma cruzi TaxID=5693 RepID=A0A2V2W9Q4_TRYCR|nr:hypothetical protein C3747_141g55 [Trypanosoma cruzi]